MATSTSLRTKEMVNIEREARTKKVHPLEQINTYLK